MYCGVAVVLWEQEDELSRISSRPWVLGAKRSTMIIGRSILIHNFAVRFVEPSTAAAPKMRWRRHHRRKIIQLGGSGIEV